MTNEIGDIKLIELLNEEIGSLYMSKKWSDITLYVEDEQIPAHRSIIGVRCEYLNTYFSTSLNEPNKTKFKLNVPLEPFKVILKYLYTGQMNLSKIKDIEILIQILNLVEEYCLFIFKIYFENYFKKLLSIENVCRLLEIGRIYELNELKIKSFDLIDKNSEKILTSESFLNISKELLEEILARNPFHFVSDICIFDAINKWSRKKDRNIEDVIHLVNLSILPSWKLINIRSSGTLTDKKIFDAIEMQISEKPSQRSIIRNDITTNKILNTTRIAYDMEFQLLNNNSTSYDATKGYIRQTITKENDFGIIVELNRTFILNHLKILLWDLDSRSYSYFIEISTDLNKWERIIDYSSYSCRSWQNLYFSTKPIKYIKIVGTHCSKGNYFDVVAMEAYYEKCNPEIKDGIIVPKDNVALVELGATVIEGWGFHNKDDLINGDVNSGYTGHYIEPGKVILLRLSQPYYINSMTLLLHDFKEDREYKYYVATSLTTSGWEVVADKRNEFSKSWQKFSFTSKPVIFIKIVGTDFENLHNDPRLYVKHFECPTTIKEQ